MLDIVQKVATSDFAQAVLLLVLGVVIQRFVTAKGKLVWGLSHGHHYLIPRLDADGSFPVRTRQIWFQNLGRASLENVEIVLNWKPQHLEIWDPRHYEDGETPDGRYSLRFPFLAGGEFFTLSMIDTFQDLPNVVSVRSTNGLGKDIPMGPQRLFPRWVLFLSATSAIIGAITVAVLLLQAVLALPGLTNLLLSVPSVQSVP